MVASRKASPGDEVAGFSTTSWSARAGSRRSLEVVRQRQGTIGEGLAVDVEADVGRVDGRDAVLRDRATSSAGTASSAGDS